MLGINVITITVVGGSYLIVFPELETCLDGHYLVITAQASISYHLYNDKTGSTIVGSLTAGETDAYHYIDDEYWENSIQEAPETDVLQLTVFGPDALVHVVDDCRAWTSDHAVFEV